MADDDEEPFSGLYEKGRWIWDEISGGLVFVSETAAEEQHIAAPKKVVAREIDFRDDIDLIEQFRYRRRYQRKLAPGQPDTITLQDVKDIAIYTAPLAILSPRLINMLHLPTMERFLRAMILYVAYYLQASDLMAMRVLELQTKVRSPNSEIVRNELRENICDLRLLVAKEYCTLLMGGADTKKYHHMGASKNQKSLSYKDANLYESLLRMTIQIVWLALGRKQFSGVEIEVNRVFKSDIFNSAEHVLKTGYIQKMTHDEYTTVFGKCLRHDKKLNSCSPLMNEVFCERDVDFRALGLGVIQYPKISNRLRYMWAAICANEDELSNMSVVLGIIGMSRKKFDTMLRALPVASEKSKIGTSVSRAMSSVSSKKSSSIVQRLYPEIVLPPKTDIELVLYI